MEILASGNFKNSLEQNDETHKDTDLQLVNALFVQDTEYYETLFAEPEKINLFRAWWHRQETAHS